MIPVGNGMLLRLAQGVSESGPGPGGGSGLATELDPLRMLGPTLVVLLLTALVLLVIRWSRTRGKLPGGARLQLVERLDLSPGHALYVVRAEGRRLLLGGAPSGLSLLTELDAAPATIVEPDRRGPAWLPEPLGDWLGRAPASTTATPVVPVGSSESSRPAEVFPEKPAR